MRSLQQEGTEAEKLWNLEKDTLAFKAALKIQLLIVQHEFSFKTGNSSLYIANMETG